jgi:hypothetical protein
VSLPATFILTVVLLMGTAARAQPIPVPEQRQRSVTVTVTAAEPPHEIRVAKGVVTLLLFKDRINQEAVEVDTQRVRILASGDGSLVFEPLVEPGAGGALVLSVPFADGDVPARAAFMLVSSPTEVDTRVEVVRREPTAEPPARCANLSPARFARDGWLTKEGVRARKAKQCARAKGAPECGLATVYRAQAWVLLDVSLTGQSGQPPWTPREVTLKGMQSGAPVELRSVELVPAKLQPGAKGRLFVEAVPPTSEEEFILEVRDGEGRGFTIERLDLSMTESKP